MKKLIVSMGFVVTAAFNYGQAVKTDTAVTNFINRAVKGGLMEVNAGKLALKRGNSPLIKAFGARMVNDHTTANNELEAILNNTCTNTSSLASYSSSRCNVMNSSGSNFDIADINMMVKDHKEDIALYERAASKSTDSRLKAFASRKLPVLKQHYASIQQIADKMNIAYDK